MSKEAIVIRMEAKHDKAKELELFLKAKVEEVTTEQGTNSWYLLKVSEVAFSIFASFSSEESAKAYLTGAALKSIFAKAPDLMTKDPLVAPLELMASKIGDKVTIAPETPLGTRRYNLRFIDGL